MSEEKMMPKIRFLNHDKNWIREQFNFLLEKKDGIRRGPFGSALKKDLFVKDSNYVVYEQQNAIYNNFDTRYNITEEKYKELINFKLEPGDFIMSGAGTIGKVSFVHQNIKTGIINQALIRMKTSKINTDKKFFYHFMQSPIMQKNLTRKNAGSAMTNLIPMAELKATKIQIPENIDEQQKIGNLFEKLDQAISLQQQVLEATKDYKQSMLQKMFTKKDEEVPEIRFDKYFSPWNKIKLEKTIKKEFKGKTKESDLKKGDIEYLNTERLNGGEAYLSNAEKDVNFDDIIILWDGSKAGTVYSGFSGALGSTLKNYIIDLEFFDSSFVYQSLKKEQDRIYNQYRTPNIPHVIKDFTESFKISVPSLEEQQKIGSFFKTLDEKIEQEEKKLEAYESMKKALMQRMFV